MASKKRPSKKRKPGPKSAADIIDSSSNDAVTRQFRRTAFEVMRKIEELTAKGEEIPMSLLGTARLMAEWHTDYLTVEASMPDVPWLTSGEGQEEGS